MNRQRHTATGLLLAGLLLSSHLGATELVYTPVNPSFGGSPLNGAWMLGNAQAQDDHKDPDAVDRSSLAGSSTLSRFTSQLEASLLSEMLGKVRDGTSNTGSLTTDDFIVNLVNDSGILSVQITDRLTGEMSEVIVNGYGTE